MNIIEERISQLGITEQNDPNNLSLPVMKPATLRKIESLKAKLSGLRARHTALFDEGAFDKSSRVKGQIEELEALIIRTAQRG